MKKIIFCTLLILTLSCKKSGVSATDVRGCVYGKNIISGQREFIKCTYHDMYVVGSNQAALDAIANKNGYQHENGSIMKYYTNWEFVYNTDCNCPL